MDDLANSGRTATEARGLDVAKTILSEFQDKAFELAQKLPWPDRKVEEWRFTSWRKLVPPDWGGEEPAARPDGYVPELDPGDLSPGAENRFAEDGISVFGARVGNRVQVAPILAEASSELESWLRGLVEKGKDRFDAVALATLRRGASVEVASGEALEAPLVLVRQHGSGRWDSTLSRIRLGAGSKGTLIVLDRPAEHPGLSYGVDLVEIELEAGAGWTVVFLQVLPPEARRLQRSRLRFAPQSGAHVVRLDLGGAVVKAETVLRFDGEDAGALYRGAFLLNGSQHLEADTLQDHATPGDHSDLLVKGAVGEAAKAVYRGRIWIRKGAQRSNAYQANRNLLLSREAHVHSIPMLDIEANDVRCTHGSASGPVDQTQVFYMQSRGIPEAEARKLIVEGFLLDALAGLSSDRLSGALERTIAEKLDRILSH